jgi:chemosensory pili system protein ChpC
MVERISEIYSLLVPLLDGRLIIPRSCVAEVVGFQTPSDMPGAPPWYLGMFGWSGR